MSELPNVADFDYTSMCALGSNRCACGPVKGLDNFWNMLDDSWNVLLKQMLQDAEVFA